MFSCPLATTPSSVSTPNERKEASKGSKHTVDLAASQFSVATGVVDVFLVATVVFGVAAGNAALACGAGLGCAGDGNIGGAWGFLFWGGDGEGGACDEGEG